jgi:Arc/MetJ family transcription regulator
MSAEEMMLEAIKAMVREAVRDEVREQLDAYRALAETAPAGKVELPTSELDAAFNAVPAPRRKSDR